MNVKNEVIVKTSNGYMTLKVMEDYSIRIIHNEVIDLDQVAVEVIHPQRMMMKAKNNEESNHSFTSSELIDIYNTMNNSRLNIRSLAEKYNVSVEVIRIAYNKINSKNSKNRISDRGRPLSARERDEVLRLRENTNMTLNEIAESFGVKPNVISKILVKHGVRKNELYDETTRNTISDMYDKGISVTDIAKTMSIKYHNVYNLLRNSGKLVVKNANKLDKSIKHKIVSLREEGFSIDEIAILVELDKAKVYNILYRKGMV